MKEGAKIEPRPSEFAVRQRCSTAFLDAALFTPGVPDQDGLLTWWQLSFVGDDGFLGGALVEAPSLLVAVIRAHCLDCNPGGEVDGFGFRAHSVDSRWTDRLLTRDEVLNMPEDGFLALPAV